MTESFPETTLRTSLEIVAGVLYNRALHQECPRECERAANRRFLERTVAEPTGSMWQTTFCKRSPRRPVRECSIFISGYLMPGL